MRNHFENSDLVPDAGSETNEGFGIQLEGGETIPNKLPDSFTGGFPDKLPTPQEALDVYRQRQTIPGQFISAQNSQIDAINDMGQLGDAT